MRRCICPLVFLALVSTVAIDAHAQTELEKARILFDAGVQAYTAGRYDEAVESFHEAYVVSGKPQALFSLAQAERRLYLVSQDVQHLRSAIEHFREYLSVVKDGGRRSDAAEALEQLEVIAAKETKAETKQNPTPEVVTGKVLISTATPGALISLDGAPGEVSPMLEVVSPGKHSVRVSAPGYITEEREIVAIEKSLVPLEITLREEPSYLALTTQEGARVLIDGRGYGEAPIDRRVELKSGAHSVTISLAGYYSRRKTFSLAPGKTETLDVPLGRTRQRIASYVFLGAAGAGLLASGVQGVIALRQQSAGQAILDQTRTGNITQAQLEEYNTSAQLADRFRSSALITFVGAGILGVAGVVTYSYESQRLLDETTPPANPVAFSFTLAPSSAGLEVKGQF